MKIAVLWSHLSGYLNACLHELSKLKGVELFISNFAASGEAPFQRKDFLADSQHLEWKGNIDKAVLLDRLSLFSPDAFLVVGWHIPEYRYVLRRFRGKAVRVMAMDNPWEGRPKQWLGVLTSRAYIHPLYEAAFVAGERQAQFARKMGFRENRILKGMYCCDHDAFASVFHDRKRSAEELPRAFIYVGRFSKEKGIDTLKRAYTHYQSRTEDPWTLICCGAGQLGSLLENTRGIVVKGFMQPEELPSEMKKASCLLLPSYWDHWGVAIHEATSAGLAVICSASCGASVHLVQDGYNGYLVDRGDALGLAEAMLRYTRLHYSQRQGMSESSYYLSLQFTPARWAAYFYERVLEMRQEQKAQALSPQAVGN